MEDFKKLFWIDDNITDMGEVAAGTFDKLWKEKIISTVFFFGDAYKEEEDEEDYGKDEKYAFLGGVANVLRKYCKVESEALEGTNARELWENYKDVLLPKESVKILKKSAYEGVTNRCIKEVGEGKGNTEELEKELVDYIEKATSPVKECSFALDIDLFYNDKESVISMLLFHGLKNRGYSCFLYTARGYDEPFLRSWKQKYSELYKDQTGEDTEIAHRKNMNEKSFEDRDIERLIKVCTKSNDEGNGKSDGDTTVEG